MSSTLTPGIGKGHVSAIEEALSEEIDNIRRKLKAAEEERAASERSIAALRDAVDELKIEISKLAASRHPSGSSTPSSCTGEHCSNLGHVRSAVYLTIEPQRKPAPTSGQLKELAALHDKVNELNRELRCMRGQCHRSQDRSPSSAARCCHSGLGHVRSAVYLDDPAEAEAVESDPPSTTLPSNTAATADLQHTMDLASKVSSISREELESFAATSAEVPAVPIHVPVEDAAIGGRRYAGASLCGPPWIATEDRRDGEGREAGGVFVRLTT